MKTTDWKAKLKDATQQDLTLLKLDEDCGDIKWAVSIHSSCEFAWFLRKADAEKFISSFPVRIEVKDDVDERLQALAEKVATYAKAVASHGRG